MLQNLKIENVAIIENGVLKIVGVGNAKITTTVKSSATGNVTTKVKEMEKEASFAEMSIQDHMKFYEDQGTDHKEAMKLVAKDRGISKREVYRYLLEEEENS